MKVDDIEDGEPTPALPDMEAKDNYDIPTNILCGDDQDGRGAKASELKKKLEDIQEPKSFKMYLQPARRISRRLLKLY